ncbi:MAG: 5'-3' exonuclease H3TH domain-containing protein [Candidatus Beckwithbacteria bacterium]
MKRLVLIDGHALVFRAYYAYPSSLTTPEGEQINAVYGFASMLLTIIKDLHPEYLAMAFDLDKPTFRHQEFVGYKAQRPEVDVELKDQLERVREVVRTLNIPIFEVEGFEGDDVIGTLACQAKNIKDEIETVIVTGDKDALQLVDNGRVLVYVPARGKVEARIYDEAAVEEKMGVEPEQLIDLKALAGDSSDNIKGVSGIGPKTAVEMIKKFGSVEKIYENLDKLSPAILKKMTEGFEDAVRSKRLVTIVCDVPLSLDLRACLIKDYDQKKVVKLFTGLGFKSLIKKLPKEEHESCFSPRLFE